MHFLEMCQGNAAHIPGVTVHCAKYMVWVPASGTESFGAQARAHSTIKLSGRDFSIQRESSVTFFQCFASHQNIPGSKLVYLDICIRWIITKESQMQLKQAAAQSLFCSSFSENATVIYCDWHPKSYRWIRPLLLRYMGLIFLAMLSNRKVII